MLKFHSLINVSNKRIRIRHFINIIVDHCGVERHPTLMISFDSIVLSHSEIKERSYAHWLAFIGWWEIWATMNSMSATLCAMPTAVAIMLHAEKWKVSFGKEQDPLTFGALQAIVNKKHTKEAHLCKIIMVPISLKQKYL